MVNLIIYYRAYFVVLHGMEAYVVKDIRLEDECIYVAFSDIYISFNSMSIMMVFVLRKPLSGLTANKLSPWRDSNLDFPKPH